MKVLKPGAETEDEIEDEVETYSEEFFENEELWVNLNLPMMNM